ncbi:hypothetical protein HYQ44_000345 [Verticillium longisporum]|nr:hypothetical protein HYQ44_000345 [Verticillium longisporum]
MSSEESKVSPALSLSLPFAAISSFLIIANCFSCLIVCVISTRLKKRFIVQLCHLDEALCIDLPLVIKLLFVQPFLLNLLISSMTSLLLAFALTEAHHLRKPLLEAFHFTSERIERLVYWVGV